MVYMGSKNRIAKELIPIITKDLKPNQWYCEKQINSNLGGTSKTATEKLFTI